MYKTRKTLCPTDFMESDQHTFVWKISNFSSRPEKIGEVLKSKEFPINGPGARTTFWHVQLYPKGQEEGGYISAYLYNGMYEDIDAKFVLSVLNANCTLDVKRFKRAGYRGNDGHCAWGWSKIVKIDDISRLAPDDTLTLTFKITIIVESSESINYAECGTRSLVLAPNYHQKELAQDFSSLFNSRHQSDVTVKCGDKLFDCHQIILASRSQFFKKMFESNMYEKFTGSVEIKEIDHKVFEDVLKYIYSGEAPNIDDHTEELLAATDQYQLEKLKELCEVKLCSKLDVSNCIDLLLLGDLHHASTLKPASLNFVSKNLDLIDLSEWEAKLMANPTLMAQVLKMMLSKESDSMVEVKKQAAFT